MTIVAGFKCHGGIVLCADTQETVSGLSKRNVPKLRFEKSPAASLLAGQDIAVAFCGSADNGPFMDEIIDKAWEDVQDAISLDEACESIKNSIKNSYKEFGKIYQQGLCPTAELIYGVKVADQSRLFAAYGPAVNEKHDYATGGIGYYMADFLASRMYGSLLTLRQCIILAAYVLFQAKEHVEGCGGDSHIAALRNDGTSGLIDSAHVETVTNLVKDADAQVGKILMKCANREFDKTQFMESSTSILKVLASLRETEIKKLEEWEAIWFTPGIDDTDDFGLPKLPSPAKDEQE